MPPRPAARVVLPTAAPVAGPSAVDAMMKKAVTSSAAFFQTPGQCVESFEARKARLAAERKAQKTTLTQWYGMKRVRMTPELSDELELLRYRTLLEKEGGRGNKVASKQPLPQFFEMGHFAGTGQKKRKKFKSFADEWMHGDKALADKVTARVAKDVKANRRDAKRVRSRLAGETKREGKQGHGAGRKKMGAERKKGRR